MPTNSLLERHTLPPFSQIKPEHLVPAVKTLTENNLAQLAERLQNLSAPTWDNLIAPLENDGDTLSQAWAPVGHLNLVANSAELRSAYEEALALLSPYYTALGQNQTLCSAYQTLKDSTDFAQLSQAQQTTIEHALRDFKLSGIDLPADQQKRYGEIQAELSQLTSQFSNNVLDASQGWFYQTDDEAELSGLPASIKQAAQNAAEQKKTTGFVLTLDGPVYMAVMTYADKRELRHKMYQGYNTRASDQGPTAGQWNNAELMENILRLRQELAHLLGFAHYSELSLATKMAESPEQVIAFLEEMAAKAKPAAKQDLQELTDWVAREHGATDLQHWDISYYSEKLRQAKYSVSSEEIRQYFTLPKVLSGLFTVAQKLYGIEVKEVEGQDLWHKDARYFEISKDGQKTAAFYLDLYSREGKRGGAWMDDCRVRRQTANGLQLPVAFLVCNFNGPVGDKPALLTHDDVTTLFHEFGHGLHHMMTQIDIAAVSGINGVEWDAVELPSQIMENWAWEPEVLKTLSAHVDTGEPLPDELIAKMMAAKNFQSGMFLVRQVEFALFDMQLHAHYGTPDFKGIQATLDEVRRKVSVITPPSFNRFQNSFSHIFAGGYSAGYYSYLWAEVLSADAYSAFEETGIFNPDTGQRFLNELLSQGGSQSAAVLFKNFRGRDPEVDALLRHSGIAA
ncbi:MAG: oligopeptidase A [Marinagarivorans sp.]|nr:oligopeptidase A [Marinagarivorans sp.]